MNKYQTKLEEIKARRINYKQRLFSLAITILLLALIYLATPYVLVTIWSDSGFGYNLQSSDRDSMSTLLFVGNCIATIMWVFIIFYSISYSLRHFVRFLSGIKERKSKIKQR